jgi:DNA-binding beta-propeller fold protein YncE
MKSYASFVFCGGLLFLAACIPDPYVCSATNHCAINPQGQAECQAGYVFASSDGGDGDYRCFEASAARVLVTDDDPQPGVDPYRCTAQNYCRITSDGYARCDTGYTWKTDHPTDYRCISNAPPADHPEEEDENVIDETPVPAPSAEEGIDFLGGGTHQLSAVKIEVLASASSGLKRPTDVALHPFRNELWITSRGDGPAQNADETMVIITSPNGNSPSSRVVRGSTQQASQHFFAAPSSLSFNEQNGTFATIHDTNNATQWNFMGQPATPTSFMGPTLWLSYDYAPAPGLEFDTGHGSHLDMLHHTPLGKGIAWERDNIYWVFDGEHNSIVRYDFQTDHGAGGADHSDGVVIRTNDGEAIDVNGMPSHLYFERTTGKLFVANSGRSAISVMDTSSLDFSPWKLNDLGFQATGPNFDGTTQGTTDISALSTLVDGTANGLNMQRPCGIDLHNNTLIVSDNQSATIFAFDSSTGDLVDYLSLASVASDIMGLVTDQQGKLYVVDSTGNQVLRISAR